MVTRASRLVTVGGEMGVVTLAKYARVTVGGERRGGNAGKVRTGYGRGMGCTAG